MRAWEDLYFGALGIVLALAGVAELLVGISGNEFSVAFVTISGTYLLWRGVVVVSAGAFFLNAAAKGLDTRRNQGLAVLATIMLGIVAGTDVLARVLGAIPGGSDVWIASADRIVGSVAPPYTPSMVFVVFALVTIRYAVDGRGENAGGEDG